MSLTARRLCAVFLLVGLLLLPSRALAQSADDHVFVGGQVVSAARLDDRPGKRWSQRAAVDLAPPSIVLGQRDRLSLRMSYRYTGIELDPSAAIGNEPRRWDLHAVAPSVTYSRILGRRWILSLGASPSLATDFRTRFSFDDVQITGFGILTYLVGGSPSFRLSFAAIAQNRSVFSPVLPFVTVDYRNEHVLLSAGLSGAHALALLGDRVEVGLFGSIGGGQYHVRSGTDDARLVRAKFLRMIEVGAGPELNVRVAGPVWLEARGGYNLLQSARFTDANLDKVSGLSLDAKGAFVGQVGIGIR